MRPPKFIPTCDSILILNVASTLQWKRRRIRRVAWYAEDDFNVNPTSSLLCHVSCADFFRRRALFLPLTRRPWGPPGWDPSPAPVRIAQMFVRTVVRMRVIVSYSLLFISILLNIFCPYFSILLDFIFSCATQTLFLFYLPPTYVATRR